MDNKENTKENLSKKNLLEEGRSSSSMDKKIIITDEQKRKLKKIRFVSRFVDYIILFISLLSLVIAIYAFWDTHQLLEIADSQSYSAYKPDSEDDLTFSDLKKNQSRCFRLDRCLWDKNRLSHSPRQGQ